MLHFGLATLNEKIYLTGGLFHNVSEQFEWLSKKVYCLNLLTEKWSEIPELNMRRKYHSSCCLGKRIYVYGGVGG